MSREYWLKRAQENDARNRASEEAGISKVRKAFENAEKEIQSRLDKFYLKYSEDGKIDLANIRKRLTPAEMTALRKELSKLSRTAATEEERARLEALKARVYISRQEALLEEIRYHASKLGAETEEAIESTLTQIYTNQSSHQQYNVEQQIGWAVNFEGLSSAQINTIVHIGYDGSDFSSRVWGNTQALVGQLNVLLPQQFLMGRSSQELGAALAKAMGTSRRSAETTIRTEGSHISALADMKVYSDAGLETYEFLATLDARTSEECQALDGMHFKVSEAQAGVNLPPMHGNCRSTTLPDVDMEGYDETRLAKTPDGKYVSVPKMTYASWSGKEWQHSKLQKIYGLTDDEARALQNYTSFEAYALNEALREKKKLSVEQKELKENLDSALKKLPIFQGTVYRSVSTDRISDVDAFVKQHAAGKTVSYDAYTSTGKMVYDESFEFQFKIQSLFGRDLTLWKPDEGEVLFERNSKFKVDKVQDGIIYMHQIR